MIIILFGLPGAGKTYVGKIFETFDFFFYDGDTDLTDEMKEAIPRKEVFTDEMRDRFFIRLINTVSHLALQHNKLVVSQMFIKEKYRTMLLQKIPNAQFVLVTTNNATREKRLVARKENPLDLEYSRIMVRNFEQPRIHYTIIDNTTDGRISVNEQISALVHV